MKGKKILQTIFLSLIVLIITTNYTTKAIDKIRLYVNREEIASPIIMNDMTYVPIRFVAEALGAKVQWNQEKRQVDINSPVKVIASIPEENIYLYALNEVDGMYKGLVLSVKGKNKFFEWDSTTELAFLPKLYYTDLTNDKKKELIVTCYIDHGTGIAKQDVYIINTENLTEYKIENPLKSIKNNVQTKILQDKRETQIKINNNINNVKIEADIDNKLFENVCYGSIVKYKIKDDTLICSLIAEAGISIFVGYIDIHYSFQDGEFKSTKYYFKDMYED